MNYKEYLAETEKRNHEIYGMKSAGKKLSDIAARFKLSRQRVAQIIERIEKARGIDKV